MTPIQRSALCAAIAATNIPHIEFWAQHAQVDATAYNKLLSKVLSYLRGELKSQANLMRFHDEFSTWREQQTGEDSLAYRILELGSGALYSAVESLFDPECNDLELLEGVLDDCWQEMAELGGEVSDLRQYWAALKADILSEVSERRQLPLPKSYFTLLKDADVSLFGMGN